MKKIIAFLLLICVVFTGCTMTSSRAYTYNVETGDTVRILLDTTDGYGLTSELPFTITCDGESLTQGKFITLEGYDLYADAVDSDERSVLLGGGTRDGNEYIHWIYQHEEFNYIIKIAGSNTAVLLYNGVSEESARECFERLTITKEG